MDHQGISVYYQTDRSLRQVGAAATDLSSMAALSQRVLFYPLFVVPKLWARSRELSLCPLALHRFPFALPFLLRPAQREH